MKNKSLSIALKPIKEAFTPGEYIEGDVVLHLTDEILVTSFVICLRGVTSCNFGKKGKRENLAEALRETHFSEAHKNGEKELCHEEFSLIKHTIGTDGTKVKVPLASGTKTYPFSFKLPSRLPSSFKGNWGSISYELMAKLETADANSSDEEVTTDSVSTPFNVHELIDANRTLYKNGFTGNAYKAYGITCFSSSWVEITGRVDRVCYLPGDIIHIDARVVNYTDKKIKALKAKLFQKICYHYKKRILIEEIMVAKVVSEDLAWDKKPLAVPDITPNVVCELIEKKHVLRLQAEGLTAEIPIIIGSVPYKQPGQHSEESTLNATSSKSPSIDIAKDRPSTLTLPIIDYRAPLVMKGTSSSTDEGPEDLARSVSC